MSDLKLIVGLGNPGPSYTDTRHNAGIWLLQKIASSYGATFSGEKTCKADVASFSAYNCDFKLLIPKVYMNNNGAEIAKYMRYFKYEIDNLLVLHDELDFNPGVVRFKVGGGCAGHNGLKSIKSHLGSTNFARLRIGIGHPGHADQVSNYVLTKASKADRDAIERSLDDTLDKFPLVLQGHWQQFMQELHT